MSQNNNSSKGLPIILCECGEEILVVPDLKEMVRCIDTHAMIHKKKETDSKKAKAEYIRIEEQLTQKVVIKIADSENTGA